MARGDTGGHDGRVRPVTDDDASALIELVAAAYAEYDGCVLDLPGVDADLTAPRAVADRRGGEWWVVGDDNGQILATCGWAPGADDTEAVIELKRLYVAPRARRQGLATALADRVEHVARRRGVVAIELWSDSRFEAAHRLYRRLGYVATGDRRRLHDPSDTTEYRFVKRL